MFFSQTQAPQPTQPTTTKPGETTTTAKPGETTTSAQTTEKPAETTAQPSQTTAAATAPQPEQRVQPQQPVQPQQTEDANKQQEQKQQQQANQQQIQQNQPIKQNIEEDTLDKSKEQVRIYIYQMIELGQELMPRRTIFFYRVSQNPAKASTIPGFFSSKRDRLEDV